MLYSLKQRSLKRTINHYYNYNLFCPKSKFKNIFHQLLLILLHNWVTELLIILLVWSMIALMTPFRLLIVWYFFTGFWFISIIDKIHVYDQGLSNSIWKTLTWLKTYFVYYLKINNTCLSLRLFEVQIKRET
jgi:hypothetical protein